MANNKMVVSLAILLVAVLLGLLFVSYNKSSTIISAEGFEDYTISEGVPEAPKAQSVASLSNANPDAASSGIGGYSASEPQGNEVFNAVTSSTSSNGVVDFPRDRLTAEDLLPKDAANSKWAKMNPAGQGDVLDQNFLTAGYHVGVNTQGQSLRNANLQLRSEPANPQLAVSPWNIATIEPDNNRKPLEIGGDY